jgi:hypothetical protein
VNDAESADSEANQSRENMTRIALSEAARFNYPSNRFKEGSRERGAESSLLSAISGFS